MIPPLTDNAVRILRGIDAAVQAIGNTADWLAKNSSITHNSALLLEDQLKLVTRRIPHADLPNMPTPGFHLNKDLSP